VSSTVPAIIRAERTLSTTDLALTDLCSVNGALVSKKSRPRDLEYRNRHSERDAAQEAGEGDRAEDQREQSY
jgi:hypothetical protein